MATRKQNRRAVLWVIPLMIALAAATLIAGAGRQAIPAETRWASSGHADETAEAFLHWGPIDGNPLEDPCTVQAGCARCHSGYGFMGFVGESLPPGILENQVGLVDCTACHNDLATALDSVVFPSGVEITGLGPETRCLQCHQGRESTVSVNQRITDSGVIDFDEPNSALGFRNVHYYATGATLYAGAAMGGYQYDGKMYDVKFAHVEGIDTCVDCYDPPNSHSVPSAMTPVLIPSSPSKIFMTPAWKVRRWITMVMAMPPKAFSMKSTP